MGVDLLRFAESHPGELPVAVNGRKGFVDQDQLA
jgi:hypothetical protein